MKYKCLLCNKEFSQKSNYEAHTKRKFKCNQNITTIIDDNNILSKNYTNITQNYLKNEQTTQNYSKNDNYLICVYCGKNYSRKQNLERHQMTSCKKKINTDNNINIFMEEMRPCFISAAG